MAVKTKKVQQRMEPVKNSLQQRTNELCAMLFPFLSFSVLARVCVSRRAARSVAAAAVSAVDHCELAAPGGTNREKSKGRRTTANQKRNNTRMDGHTGSRGSHLAHTGKA